MLISLYLYMSEILYVDELLYNIKSYFITKPNVLEILSSISRQRSVLYYFSSLVLHILSFCRFFGEYVKYSA